MTERRFELSGSLDIASVAELRPRLLEAMDGAEALVLDGSRVERADTAGVQLLVASAREAARRGISLTLHASSEPLERSLRALGLADAVATPARGDAAAH